MLATILDLISTVFKSRSALALENLSLRQQLAVQQRNAKRPRPRRWDRAFWVVLSRIWSDWQKVLVVVQPETVIRRHRQGVRLYWRPKSRPGRPGRPKVAVEIRALIRRMRQAKKYMGLARKPPSQTWRTFLGNHARDIVSIDFFTVPTATFRVLFVFLVLNNERRRAIHFNVTDSPTVFWTGQQIIEAFPWHTVPRFIIRDRDGIYGNDFVRRVSSITTITDPARSRGWTRTAP